MDLGRTIVRGAVGPLMIGHGTQKLFGWFDGHGLEGTGAFFEGIGLRPGRRHATAGGVAETLGGALLTLGALTPLASTLLSSVMMTAIRKVHLKNGPWVTGGGYEYNLVLIAATAALVEVGPGRPSVDEALFPRLKGNGWVLASLAAAAAGSWLATERFNEAAPEAAPAEEPALEREPRFTHVAAEAPADVT
jgi:putative oxidoreductase